MTRRVASRQLQKCLKFAINTVFQDSIKRPGLPFTKWGSGYYFAMVDDKVERFCVTSEAAVIASASPPDVLRCSRL